MALVAHRNGRRRRACHCGDGLGPDQAARLTAAGGFFSPPTLHFAAAAVICKSMNAAARIAELSRTIERHNRLYYIDAKPEISDREFDKLLEELQKLEAAHPDLVAADSPTRRVGGAPIEGFV